MKITRRGYRREDKKEFIDKVELLRIAAEEVQFLADRKYPLASAVEIVGNHHLLSKRQRTALNRSLDSREKLRDRKGREIHHTERKYFYMDGFNTIITLEVLYSHSLVLLGKDGCYRDLAGLRGNYRICDKTEITIEKILNEMKRGKWEGLKIYLDAPVSNSGNLAKLIRERARGLSVEVDLVSVVDPLLYEKENVITSDSVILDRCRTWFNLNKRMIEKEKESFFIVKAW